MNEKFNLSQFPYLVISFIMGSTLLITLVDGIAGSSTWMVMIAAFVLSIPFILAFSSLAKRFPGKNIAEMCESIFGKFIGTVINVLFLCFFFLLFTFNVEDLAAFYSGYILTDIPKTLIILPVMLTCAFSVKRGVAALTKISVITAVVNIFIVIMLTIALIPHMNLSYFLPILQRPFSSYAHATHIVMELPILECLALLMFLPQARSLEKLCPKWLLGAGVSMLLFAIIAARDTAVLGSAVDLLGENTFEAIQLVNIGDFLSRIELLVALNRTACIYVKICALYYTSVTLLSHLLRVEKGTLILPVGMIGITISAMKVRSAVQHGIWGARYAVFFSMPFLIILPLLMLLVAAIRGFRVPPAEAQALPDSAQPSEPEAKHG